MPGFQSVRRRSPLLWLFFGLNGRITRRVYWLAYLFLIALNSVLIGQLIGGEEASFYRLAHAIAPPIVLATLYANLAVGVKRLHDLGYSGYFGLALFVPVVNLAFTLWAGFLPGDAAANRFGATRDAPPA